MPNCVNAFIHVIFQWLLGIVCFSSSASLETYSKLLVYFLVLFDTSECLFQLQSFPHWKSGKWACWVNYTNFQNSTSLLFGGAEAKEMIPTYLLFCQVENRKGVCCQVLWRLKLNGSEHGPDSLHVLIQLYVHAWNLYRGAEVWIQNFKRGILEF